MRPQKFPDIPVSLEENTEVPGTWMSRGPNWVWPCIPEHLTRSIWGTGPSCLKGNLVIGLKRMGHMITSKDWLAFKNLREERKMAFK